MKLWQKLKLQVHLAGNVHLVSTSIVWTTILLLPKRIDKELFAHSSSETYSLGRWRHNANKPRARSSMKEETSVPLSTIHLYI
jgi:hypothetical protein